MTEFLIRRNPVLEALRGRREVVCLWLQEGMDRKTAVPFLTAAQARNIPVKYANKQKLGNMAQDSSHQGVLLEVGPYPYSDVSEMLALAAQQGEKPFLLLFDLLHGPQNIGQLLRTAEIVGVHGVIMQDRRAPEITPAVVQYAAGATEHLHIAQVTNLVSTMKQLQAEGVWVVGMDMGEDTRKLGQVDLDMPLGIVVGHEGQGLRRLVRQSCDFILELPMRGHVASLNAAVAGSVLLYAAWEARGFKQLA
ncbi:MAG: 23S rRNA (guanosine(2251)-2'-O)-methyltransferase RlmB [Anaerolineales bacterium]|nr:23S rRNA (guanosine(2251)-2'-O)-methyltransferase RlmB [Anaerolineales bacterium]